MEKLRLKGRLYLDALENYKRKDDKGREYVQVKLMQLNEPSQYGSTHIVIVDTWNNGKREDKEPTACWLEPIFKNAQSAPTQATPPPAVLPKEDDEFSF